MELVYEVLIFFFVVAASVQSWLNNKVLLFIINKYFRVSLVVLRANELNIVIVRTARNRQSVTVGRRSAVSRVSLRKVVAMVLVLAALGAACAAVLFTQGFLCMLVSIIILGIVYLLAFHQRWLYVAIKTTPRDLR